MKTSKNSADASPSAYTAIARVKKITYQEKKDGYTIFMGQILVKRKRGHGYKTTSETKMFLGNFTSICINDIFEIQAHKVENPYYGEQYQVITHHRIYPGTLDELRTFLLSRKMRIGPKRVDLLLDKYGLDTLLVVERDPHAFDSLPIPPSYAAALRKEIVENRTFEETLVLLQVYNLDQRYAMPLFMKYHEETLTHLQNSPYAPYLDGIIDFRTADQLNQSMGYPYNSNMRVAMVVYAALRFDSERVGNLYLSRSCLRTKCEDFLERQKTWYENSKPFTATEYEQALTYLARRGLICVDTSIDAADPPIYLFYNFTNETNIVKYLQGILAGKKQFSYTPSDVQNFLSNYEQKSNFLLAPGQNQAVIMALTNPISILTGGPGTGKTQTINAIISAIETLTPSARIKLAAPTGKAANRMAELSGKSACTIHRMIGLGSFQTKSIQPGQLDCDFLVIDEFSMADAYLTYRLLLSVSTRTQILFVGDYDQLPSVGPGLVLRDFINSGCIPFTRLNTIFRQAQKSRIVENAHRIIVSTSSCTCRSLKCAKHPNGDFYFIEATDPEIILKTILRSVKRLLQSGSFEIDDIQVLSPLRKPVLGVDALNSLLRERLNPHTQSLTFQDREFRLGDRVIHVINNYELAVFNGETGIIKSFGYQAEQSIEVSFPHRDIWYGIKDLEQLELAYATSVHRAQGSEFPVVIMPVHETLSTALNRNVLYTAITRAKQMLILVGSKTALAAGIHKDMTIERNSNLSLRLKNTSAISNTTP